MARLNSEGIQMTRNRVMVAQVGLGVWIFGLIAVNIWDPLILDLRSHFTSRFREIVFLIAFGL